MTAAAGRDRELYRNVVVQAGGEVRCFTTESVIRAWARYGVYAGGMKVSHGLQPTPRTQKSTYHSVLIKICSCRLFLRNFIEVADRLDIGCISF
jgi:hypothetical protein